MPAVCHMYCPRPVAAALAFAFVLAAAPQGAIGQSDPAPGTVRTTDATPASPGKPSPPLTADLMYRLLIGDIALQRGEPALAARAYYEAAREAKDPMLARRATEIALAARQRGVAVDAARLWSELDPAAERPKQVIASAGATGGAKSVDVARRRVEVAAREGAGAGRGHARRARRRLPAAQSPAGPGAGQGRRSTISSPRWPYLTRTCRRRISPWRWPR